MTKRHVLVVLLAAVVAVAATAPVAMRVEVEPLRAVDGNTEVALIIQVAPMDRGRIGSNAIVRIELDEGRVSSGSPVRAVGAEDDGSFRVVVEWPPGEHDLRVAIEDPSREDTGLWVGTVRIPDLGQGAPGRETEEAGIEPVPEPVPEPETSEPVTRAARSEAPPETAEEPTVKPAPEPELEVAEERTVEPAPAPEPEPETPDETLVEPLRAESPAETTVPEAIEPAASAESVPEPELEVAEERTVEPAPAPEPGPETPDETLVEPLRAEPPAETTAPEAIEPAAPAEVSPLAAPVSADRAARYAEWEQADQEALEFSVIAMRGRDPAQNLGANDLRLKVGGTDVAIEQLGDSQTAPLLLGLAIDVEADDVADWSGMRGSLAPITDRAGGGRGRLFVTDSTGVGDWGAGSESRESIVGSQPAMNVAQQVVASLERFRGERGRTFLVVLTDGRGEPNKDDWKRANDAAGTAGVPILVVALWDDEFSSKTRKNLKKLTVDSGGSLFLVQGRGQLPSAADRFGRYLDGGYAVRFRRPPAAQGAVMPISVTATDREITISAPESIR